MLNPRGFYDRGFNGNYEVKAHMEVRRNIPEDRNELGRDWMHRQRAPTLYSNTCL